MRIPEIFECEVWINGSWAIIPVETALCYPGLTKRCKECKGRIRLHKAGPMNRPRAHAEHWPAFSGCSIGARFTGYRSPNPDIVEAPTSHTEISLIIPEEILSPKSYREGATAIITVNRYERDPRAWVACLRHYGYICMVCSRSLDADYGASGKGIIHVHHLLPLGRIRKEYVVDPVKDLRPVCPNCHAVIHSQNGSKPYTIEEVQEMRKRAAKNAKGRPKRVASVIKNA